MKLPLLWFVLLFGPLLARAQDNALTPQESLDGWRLLFNGKSLDGWRGFKESAPGKGWTVVDGAIVWTGESGDLVTVDEFSDFELSFEWKVAEGTNSGVIYRAGLDDRAPFVTGPEYQLLDNAKAHDNQKPSHLAGALYDLVAPPKDVTKPVGEWNLGRIRVRGWHVEHWLNGEKIVDVDLGRPEGKALIAQSKFSKWPRFATLSRGHLTLQDHDGVVCFRNLKIKELK